MPTTPDMLLALGKPVEPATKGKAGNAKGYLDGKPAQLRSYLEDAVDSGLSAEKRAEALCRAIEFSRGDELPETSEVGEGMGDY